MDDSKVSRRAGALRFAAEIAGPPADAGNAYSPEDLRRINPQEYLTDVLQWVGAISPEPSHVARTGAVLTEDQLRAMEKAKDEKTAWGEIETEHVGYLGSQDTFCVGTLKGVGRVYQQTFIDTYSAVGFAKLYMTKHPINSADVLNDRVIPFFEDHGVTLLRILTDRGTEYCGKPDTHEYQLFLALNDIEHTRTKTRHPQTNGICERLNKTCLNEL